MNIKDRAGTEQKIIDAVDSIFLEKGFSGLGVNAIARKAGVGKVLIYRYFDSYDGLLEKWALKNSYWIPVSADLPDNGDLKQTALSILVNQAETLRKDKLQREVTRWLLSESSELGKKIRARVEEHGLSLLRSFIEKAGFPDSVDVEAFAAIITCGTSYLALMEDLCDVYNGVRIDTDEGWKRIYRVIELLLNSMFSAVE